MPFMLLGFLLSVVTLLGAWVFIWLSDSTAPSTEEFEWPDTLTRSDVDWLAAHLILAGVKPPWKRVLVGPMRTSATFRPTP